MWSTVERNDAYIVNHFEHNRHVLARLHNLDVVVVAGWKHRRSGAESHNAPLRHTTIFRAVGSRAASSHSDWLSGGLLLRLLCKGWDLAIGGINDQGRLGQSRRLR